MDIVNQDNELVASIPGATLKLDEGVFTITVPEFEALKGSKLATAKSLDGFMTEIDEVYYNVGGGFITASQSFDTYLTFTLTANKAKNRAVKIDKLL